MDLLRLRKVERAEMSLTFVGTRRIRRLNREYLGRDRETDVIAFDLSSDDPDGGGARRAGSVLIGDIYVCVHRAAKQAARFGITLEEELIRLAVHGVLHLLGYNHESGSDSRRMNSLQEQMVEKYRSGQL